MFKKRVFSLLIVTLPTLLALLLALTLTGCRKVESGENVDVTSDVIVKEEKQVELLSETRWVTADAGLRMRDSAGSAGNKIGLIPNGEQVTLLLEEGDEETIAGASGRWSKVRWQEQEGWVFGGFLSAEQPVVVEDSVDVVESNGKTILIDGQEFDESVLYGLYLFEVRGQFYRIIEILPSNIQRSYMFNDEYHSKLHTSDYYPGLPDEYVEIIKNLNDVKAILKEIGTGEWTYDFELNILQTTFIIPRESTEPHKFKVKLKGVLENGMLKFTFTQSDYESFNYIDKSEYIFFKAREVSSYGE